jgi:hypothetical protein
MIEDRGSTLLYYKNTQYFAGDNLNYSLVIKPLRCDLNLLLLSDQECLPPESNENVRIYNKRREKFKI